jgi:hypothetical protein
MRKVIVNINKSFNRLSTDFLPFQEKECSINEICKAVKFELIIMQVSWKMTASAPHIIENSAVKELNVMSTM